MAFGVHRLAFGVRRFVLVLVLESGHGKRWSTGVMRYVGIAPSDRGVQFAECAILQHCVTPLPRFFEDEDDDENEDDSQQLISTVPRSSCIAVLTVMGCRRA